PTRQAALQKLATELHVAEHVIFAGMVPPEQLPTYFNLCDLFILVSREARQGDLEGYGIVVVEAALCGKTAIVSDHGGLPEAVHDGQTGLIVPPESPDETAQAIISLLTNEQKRASLAHEALKKAATSSWEHRVASYDAILKEMLV
ncbi:MAG: glycosyltransferase family 4 protein, partial [Anaerolineales bacterium]|nr:glycosyltransferase family 4 protein [Anaerolineales bacterium]